MAQKLALKVFQQFTVEGRSGERSVAEYAVETAPADRVGRHTLSLPQGGRYVLRAEGTDRFHNPITAAARVYISGDDDRVRLRLLCDRHTFKAGETAHVQLYWREEPALALVTFQGARVLDYRLLPLVKGSNRLEIPMAARLAPNFELAVAVMNDPHPADEKPAERFHTASSPITVERDLRVAIAWRGKGVGAAPLTPALPQRDRVATRPRPPRRSRFRGPAMKSR